MPAQGTRKAAAGKSIAKPWWILLPLAAGVFALLAIWLPWWTKRSVWGYLFTPLTMLGLTTMALTAPGCLPIRYRWSVVCGLLFSMGGDICLMLPKNLFLPGLVCFLLAHLAYLAAFTADSRIAAKPLPFVIYAIIGVSLMPWLWPGIPGPLKAPVILYTMVILGMAAQAASRALDRRELSAVCAAFGALLFVSSDCLLAINRFGIHLPAARILILFPYFTAQWLIAYSVKRPVPSLPLRNSNVEGLI